MTTIIKGMDELKTYAGKHLGYSDWHLITQEQVNEFAEVTGDHQWIHVDIERAKKSPFGGTIAHGYLTLSLIPPLLHEVFDVEDINFRGELRHQQGALSRSRAGGLEDPSRRCRERIR